MSPDQFYTGLVSQLYEPLASEKARAEDYLPFIERYGQPVLEPFCGSGSPLLDIASRGYDIDGLDASADMLALLQSRAAERDLNITTYHQLIQNMSLPRRYRSIFIAGASLNLLPDQETVMQALNRLRDHLVPEGRVLIPLEIQTEKFIRLSVGKFKEQQQADGSLIRCGVVDYEFDEQEQRTALTLRYERQQSDGIVESLERDWHLKWWQQAEFQQMLEAAGYKNIRCRDAQGQTPAADATIFIFTASPSS